MHPEAYQWVARYATDEPITLLDLGGRNINGSVLPLFPNATATVLDIYPGHGVDIVADAATWEPTGQWDVVTCCETFEHTAVWPGIVRTAYEALRPGGLFVATMAGPGRPEHSAIDGGWVLRDGEYYGNVQPADLKHELDEVGFVDVVVDQQFSPCDVRCSARKP